MSVPKRKNRGSGRALSSPNGAAESNRFHRTAPARQLRIEYVPTALLKPDPKNPRSHGPGQLEKLRKSLKTFGFLVPILANKSSQIIAGHGRWQAAIALGLAEVPVIRIEHLSDAQQKAFLIADNRLADLSQWNERLLAENLKFLTEAGIQFDIEAIGFEMPEIDLRIQGLSGQGAAGDPADELPEDVSGPPVSHPDDLWLLDEHRVLCGSALDDRCYTSLFGCERASLVTTDPPYNVPIQNHVSGKGRIRPREFSMASGEMNASQFTEFLSQSFRGISSRAAPGAIVYVFMDWRHLQEILTAGSATFSSPLNVCVWTKTNAGMGSFYRSQHELVFVFRNGDTPHKNNVQLGRFGRNRTNVWSYPGANTFGRGEGGEGNLLALHPTVKPVALVADAIMDASARGEIVLDPFLGSGSTVIAAARTGRRCYGMEIDPLYVDTIVRRWERFSGREAKHASGRTFAQIAKSRSKLHAR